MNSPALQSAAYRPGETDWLAEAQHVTELYQPPPTGRPSQALTDVYRIHKLLSLVADGNYLDPAVRAAGFARQTLYNWREQAKDGNLAAIALLDALEKAEATAEVEIVSDVRKAAKSSQFWAAGMTLISRRHRERWQDKTPDEGGPRVVVQIGVQAGEVQVSLGPSPAVSPDIHRLSAEPETLG